MDRAELYRLVEELPETEIPIAVAFLRFIIQRAQQAPVDRILDSAPCEDEELTEEEHQKIADLMLTLLEEVYMTMALDTPKLDGIINTLDKLKNRATPS